MFQFTHPGRGATPRMDASDEQARVSIHAPREGCDDRGIYYIPSSESFNSRTPGGVRRHISVFDNQILC